MTKQEFYARKREEARQAKAETRKASAKTVTVIQYIDKYFSEVPEKTSTYTIEVKDRNFGVWALRMPTVDFCAWLKAGNGIASTVSPSEAMKRYAESGKPCIRFRQISLDEAKEMRDTFGYTLKRVYSKTHGEMKKWSDSMGMPDVGRTFQKLVACAWDEEDRGEIDGKSHMAHADTYNPMTAEWSEVKCYNGFICCQMVNEYWKIEG